MARPYNLLICSVLWRSLRLCARPSPNNIILLFLLSLLSFCVYLMGSGRFEKRLYCMTVNILYSPRLCARFFIIFFSLIAQLFSIFG